MKDPVCQMEIDIRKAGAMSIHLGRAYFFCSENCQQVFDEKPDTCLIIVVRLRKSVKVEAGCA